MRYIIPPTSLYSAKHSFLLSHLMARPIDRSGSIDFGLDLKVLKKIPQIDFSFSTDFAQICQQVASELISSSELPITVLWSGGIDSTCVLCSFLQAGTKVNLALSDESVKEYPLFYQEVILGNSAIRNEIRFTNIIDYLCQHDNKFTHVSGEIADQIYFINYPGYGLSNEELFEAPLGRGIPETCMEVYQPLVEACPVELSNNYDFLWWENFTLKYQSVQARIHLHAGRRLNRLAHFFDHPLFEQWAMNNNHCVKCPGQDIHNHKYPAKELIYKTFTDESVFLMWKEKSLIKAMRRPTNGDGASRTKKLHWYIDEHWNVVKE